MAKTVTNEYGVKVYYDAAVQMMDDETREEIHAEIAPCTDQEFFVAYAKAHEEKFGEEWEPNKANPVF